VNTLFWKILVTRVNRKNASGAFVLLLQPFRGVLTTPCLRIGRRNALRATMPASKAVTAARSMRKFGEYAFLNDSRYMSQQKNASAANGLN
jgi:hypothetical protein